MPEIAYVAGKSEGVSNIALGPFSDLPSFGEMLTTWDDPEGYYVYYLDAPSREAAVDDAEVLAWFQARMVALGSELPLPDPNDKAAVEAYGMARYRAYGARAEYEFMQRMRLSGA